MPVVHRVNAPAYDPDAVAGPVNASFQYEARVQLSSDVVNGILLAFLVPTSYFHV
jgi:hypothetical protein